MNKLEQAARQILEAVEGIGFVSDYWDKKITALREALAEPVRKCDGLLCNDCGEHKQRYKDLPGLTEKDLCVCSLAEQAEQEPVGEVKILRMNTDDSKFHYVECQHLPEGTKLYAAPVRTKDLTDDEIDMALGYPSKYRASDKERDDARAVIAADREKNK